MDCPQKCIGCDFNEICLTRLTRFTTRTNVVFQWIPNGYMLQKRPSREGYCTAGRRYLCCSTWCRPGTWQLAPWSFGAGEGLLDAGRPPADLCHRQLSGCHPEYTHPHTNTPQLPPPQYFLPNHPTCLDQFSATTQVMPWGKHPDTVFAGERRKSRPWWEGVAASFTSQGVLNPPRWDGSMYTTASTTLITNCIDIKWTAPNLSLECQ